MIDRRRLLALGAFAPALSAVSACSGVGAFNAVVPNDDDATKVADGLAYGPHPRQVLDVWRPRAPGRRPSVLFVYGGSWNNGSRTDYGFAAAALASQGFVVVVPDYRLVPEVRYPDFLVDTAAALAWTEREVVRHDGDPGHIVAVGHSAGAYNAVMLALAPEIRRQGGATGRGLRGVAGLAGPYDFLPLDVSATREAFGTWPRLDETQPVKRSARGAPAMFLAAGDEDTLVQPRNTRALAAHLRSAGVPVAERSYRGIGHAGILTAFARPFRDRAPVLTEVTAFVRDPLRVARSAPASGA